MLSAYIKFGVISIREVFYAAKKIKNLKSRESLIRQLYWHDFFYYIAYHFPFVFGKNLTPTIWWDKEVAAKSKSQTSKTLNLWRNGETGFPIIDSTMRELKQTGYISNKLRLIVANFLTQILLIDWREGEKYFAQNLIDYDPAINNGNWQWTAGVGTDYYKHRIFNPWTQQKKLDPKCEYIKKWIPEIKSIENKDLHNWYKNWNQYKNIKYPRPIINF
ncbi:MAG: hypothetical protein UR43_C0008G0056 [candidate division TM6 bacterium GW2011_GWF2_33_332]|nr:MAG: hypothetical protein UR43_C0008G0056 [candidate division TM6 bacterium GW2011_GWF2_33_332]